MMANITEIIERCFGSCFEPDKKYIVAIQGCSTSGKSTLAQAMYNALKINSTSTCKPIILGQDDFYKHQPIAKMNLEDQSLYDMDNPGSIDWDAFALCIKSILSNDKIFIRPKYNYSTSTRLEIKEENIGYNVIFIEGLFALNLLNTEVYNAPEYDCLNSAKLIAKKFVPNYYGLEKFNFKNIKIFLDLNKKEMMETRIKVDWGRDHRSREDSIRIFEQYVYPSTEKWIRPAGFNSSDIQLLSGTRNISECTEVFNAISSFFEPSVDKKYFSNFLGKLPNNKQSVSYAHLINNL